MKGSSPSRSRRLWNRRDARRFDPLAVDGGCILAGDGPVSFKAAEVIEANDVVEELGTPDAIEPPGEAGLLEDVPFVQRIAPALAGGREVVRRHAGDADRREILVQLEEFRMSPHVGGVVVDEDGDVPNEADVARRAVLAQVAPLLIKGKLQSLSDGEFFAVFQTQPVERRGVAMLHVIGPVVPGGIVELAAQNRVQRPVIQPRGVGAAISFKA